MTSVIAEIPTSSFIFVISLQKKIEPNVFVLPISQFVWQDLVIACKSFIRIKKVCINHWNLMNKQKQLLKKMFCKNNYTIDA